MANRRIEGVDYVRGPGLARSGERTRRKPKLDELEARAEVCERAWETSAEIRRAAGLDPLPRECNTFRRALFAELERRTAEDRPTPAPRAERAAKPRRLRAVSAAPAASRDLLRMYRADLEALGTPEALAEVERRQAKRAAKSADRLKVAA